MERAVLSWSGGKDSVMALHEMRGACEVAALLTTVNEEYGRVSMHGVREVLMDGQAAALGVPLVKIGLRTSATNVEYEKVMGEHLIRFRNEGVTSLVFGDIFLEDLRRYREDRLAELGMKGRFPLWKRDTRELARTFIRLGYRAVVVCVDSNHLDRTFAGRAYDDDFLDGLPPGVDPCGENGEFHTFVHDGPLFRERVAIRTGEVVEREYDGHRFYFCDLLPAGGRGV